MVNPTDAGSQDQPPSTVEYFKQLRIATALAHGEDLPRWGRTPEGAIVYVKDGTVWRGPASLVGRLSAELNGLQLEAPGVDLLNEARQQPGGYHEVWSDPRAVRCVGAVEDKGLIERSTADQVVSTNAAIPAPAPKQARSNRFYQLYKFDKPMLQAYLIAMKPLADPLPATKTDTVWAIVDHELPKLPKNP